MKDSYDVVVVGGGPAGCFAAKVIADRGLEVLVLERDREIGIPVRCGEAVNESDLSNFINMDPGWIVNRISGFTLVSPCGISIDIPIKEYGCILERRIFDKEIARLAADAGAEVLTKANATGLVFDDGKVSGVLFSYGGEPRKVRSKVVIGADGVESRVGRWAGLQTACSIGDMMSCAQYVLSGVDLNPEFCQFWFGRGIAPGGYAWVFPKGKNMANVGLGISVRFSDHNKCAFTYLDEFVSLNFPKASILGVVAGGVPCSGGVRQIVSDGLVLVGDAAHQVNPLSGGGIVESIASADIAGRVVAEAVLKGKFDSRELNKYQREWNKKYGRKNRGYYKLKEIISRIPDDVLNRAARELKDIEPARRTLFQVFKVVLKDNPKILLELPALLSELARF